MRIRYSQPRLAADSAFQLGVTVICRVILTAAVAAATGAAAAQAADLRLISAQLVGADDDVNNWLTSGHGYSDRRFSPLRGINADNISRLHLAWSYDLDTHRGQESTPIEVDGVLYTSSAWSKVQAFRAATGELLWQFDPKVPGSIAVKACCDVVNRGVAVWQGRVYVGTLDGRLVALSARTGRQLWSVMTVADRGRPYSISGAPLVAGGKVIIGNGGAEYGVRGYVTAYDALTGKQAWRFFTVPGNPAKGFESDALARAAKTWSGNWWQDGGGGTVWNSFSYDPALGLVYFGTGNASPWGRPDEHGKHPDGLYTASIIAVSVDTGAYVWHYQETPGDAWDYDAAQTLTLATLNIGGHDRQVVMQASKNGFFYVLDRKTGELLSAKNFVPVNWAKGVDMSTGRPMIEPQALYYATKKVWVGAPGALGGHNWQPMAFSPMTGLVYIPAQELPFPYLQDPEFKPQTVGTNMAVDLVNTSLPQNPAAKAAAKASLKGALLAWDPVAQRTVWRVEYPGPWNGGLLTTAGGLVFQGSANGDFSAFRATDGSKLWSQPVQTGVIAAPISYSIDGRQYVTVLAGWGGAFPLVSGELAFKSGKLPNRSRVLTFSLDGKANLPPIPAAVQVEFPAPPTANQDPTQVARGERIYARICGACHGDAVHSGGVVPDLRYSRSLADDALWHAIVNEGVLTNNGMIGFKDALSAESQASVRAFIIARAQKSYAEDHR